MRGPARDRSARRPDRPGLAATLQPLVPHPFAAGLPPVDRHPSGPAHARAHHRTRRRVTSSDRSAPPRRRRVVQRACPHRCPIPTRCSPPSPHASASSPGAAGSRAEHGACEDARCACGRRFGRGTARGCSSSTRPKVASRCAADGAASRATHDGDNDSTPADVDELLLVAALDHAQRAPGAPGLRRGRVRVGAAGRAGGRRRTPGIRQPCEAAAARACAACATARCTAPRTARCPR